MPSGSRHPASWLMIAYSPACWRCAAALSPLEAGRARRSDWISRCLAGPACSSRGGTCGSSPTSCVAGENCPPNLRFLLPAPCACEVPLGGMPQRPASPPYSAWLGLGDGFCGADPCRWCVRPIRGVAACRDLRAGPAGPDFVVFTSCLCLCTAPAAQVRPFGRRGRSSSGASGCRQASPAWSI